MKLEQGNVATDWSPAPSDIDASANSREQTIYRSAADGTSSIAANTTWVTASGDTQNAWTTRRPTYDKSYPVLFVAQQRQTVAQSSGTTCSCTTPVIDSTTTVIDGGNIITGSVTANKLNASNVNASKMLTVGSMTDETSSSILNSNIEVGGRNIVRNSGNFTAIAPWIKNAEGTTVSIVTKDSKKCLYVTDSNTVGSACSITQQLSEYYHLSWNTEYVVQALVYTTQDVDARGGTFLHWWTYGATSATSIGLSNVTVSVKSVTCYDELGNDTMTSVVPANKWVRVVKVIKTPEQSGSYTYLNFKPFFYGWTTAGARSFYLAWYKLEKGNKPTDWSPAPEDIESDAINRTQRIYYRSNTDTKPTAMPTAWVTEIGNKYNANATTASGWSTKVTPITSSVESTTKYLYLWTCEQREMVDGTLAYTNVLLDDSTTIIDGGNIVTGSVTANKINATDINTSGLLSIGSLSQAAQSNVLNSNIEIGGRNLLPFSDATAANLQKTGKNTAGTSFVTEDGHDCYKVTGSSTNGAFYFTGEDATAFTVLDANTTYTYSAWIKVTTTESGVTSVSHNYSSLGHFQVINSNSTISVDHDDIASKRVYFPATVEIGKWTHIEEQFTTAGNSGSAYSKYIKYNLSDAYTVYVYGMKLEKGNKATD
jgi:hypothetical protein